MLMNRVIIGIAAAALLFSCKGSGVVLDNGTNNRLSAKQVIKTHYQNEARFLTLRGKLKIDYSDGEREQGVSVSLRMAKDSVIWISAPLGIVKAYISPERVSFYDKLQNEYFDGDFSYLSKLLGTEVNFDILQNLLLGQAIFDLREEKHLMTITDNTYQLEPRDPKQLFATLFRIEPEYFKMDVQQLTQPKEERLLQIRYIKYQEVGPGVWPEDIAILAVEGDQQNSIKLEVRNLEFNQKFRFPYSIPNGFKEIVLE